MSQSRILRSKLEQVCKELYVPGMAVTVFQSGQIVFNEGFGQRDIDADLPFTPDTVGLVASVTKSFTAALVGTLVDEGLIDWTTPVRDFYPDFKMVDDFATQEITLADMLCHRSGLPYHENLLAHGVGRELVDSGRDFRRELLDRMAHFEPAFPFRSTYQYQDIVYTCIGALIEQLTDQDYETLIAERFLTPLEMTNSTFIRREARETGRLAQGYDLVEGVTKAIDFCDTRYIAPCAGLYSTTTDISKWLKFQLEGGRVGNSQLLSKASLAWIHRPHMAMGANITNVGGGLATYCHGWVRSMLHGHALISHGGSFNGNRTFVGFMPEKRLGVAVLLNLNYSNANVAGALVALEHLFGVDAVKSRIAFANQVTQMFDDLRAEDEAAFESGRDLSNRPRNPLNNYAGMFHHPGYGTFEITLQNGLLWQSYDGRASQLEPYNGETFTAKFQTTENNVLDMLYTFECDEPDHIVAVRIPIVPDIEIPRFART